MKAERFWLLVAIVLTVLLLAAIVLVVAVIRPPVMEPVPVPSARTL